MFHNVYSCSTCFLSPESYFVLRMGINEILLIPMPLSILHISLTVIDSLIDAWSISCVEKK